MNFKIWYSTESFADYIINKTDLYKYNPKKERLYESDANNPNNFYTMPDHIRKILYLDAPDIIVELNSEPIFSIEISTEAGTGHNSFQRFARIAASIENKVPAFYIYPEAGYIWRDNKGGWDIINPLIFYALEMLMQLYNIPALLYYFPSYYNGTNINTNFSNKGLIYDSNIKYPACPDSTAKDMVELFEAINLLISEIQRKGIKDAISNLINQPIYSTKRNNMVSSYYKKKGIRNEIDMSPLSSTIEIDTKILINYLSKVQDKNYALGNLLKSRKKTIIYEVDAKFRGDPYPGCLAAIDYMTCRTGKTFEDRSENLILVFGKVNINEEKMEITSNKNTSINDFFKAVQQCSQKNLLSKNYKDLKNFQIPRYFMQVRYGSTYSKVKHIRVYSYFADAILFPDGEIWRDA